MKQLLKLIFECRHTNTSRVFSNRGGNLHWIQCFDCGKRLRYDWKGLGKCA